MIRWTCLHICSLLGRRGELITADALAVEDHLGGCPACRDVATLGDELRRVVQAVPAGAPDRTLNRALSVALSNPSGATRRPRPLKVAGILAMAAAAAALIYVVGFRSVPPTRSPEDPAPASGDRVISGAVTSSAPAGADTIVNGAEVVAVGETVLALGQARVNLSARTAITWHPRQDTLGLRSGRVLVSVAAGGGAFRVRTPGFSVEVTGTRFAVDGSRVQVFEGQVRIVAPGGAVLVDALDAGRSWELPSAIAPPAGTAPPDFSPPGGDAVPGADEHLQRARRLLGAGEVAGARRAIAAALDARPTRSQKADALTLSAESAVVAGEPARAVRLYLEIADGFGELAAGETALFSAARVETRRGGPRARQLLRRYLARHPGGQFHAEATQLLSTLEGR